MRARHAVLLIVTGVVVVGVMAACVTLHAAEILLAEPGEDHRRDDQHEPE